MRTREEIEEEYTTDVKEIPGINTLIVGRLAILCETLLDIRDLLANRKEDE